jgi:hypothetical protein
MAEWLSCLARANRCSEILTKFRQCTFLKNKLTHLKCKYSEDSSQSDHI